MWTGIKQHFKDAAVNYVVGTLIVGTVAALLAFSWNFAQGRMQAALLDTFKDALASKDPDHNPDGTLREATFARAVADFQKSVVVFVEKQVEKINGVLIGYVQSGTFTLPYGESQGKGKQSFQIFVGDKTHVYLEFNVSPFDSDSYNMQLMFFGQPVCSGHQWTTGLNVVEFEVTDILNKKWSFVGECGEPRSASVEKGGEDDLSPFSGKARVVAGAHERQLIPVRLMITDKTRTPQQASFAEAVRATGSVGARSVENKPDVTVGYIVVVSPLIQDVMLGTAGTVRK